MERKCSMCGSPMVRTSKGYKCSFCTNEETFVSNNAAYGTSATTGQKGGKKKSKLAGGLVLGGILLLFGVGAFSVLINIYKGVEDAVVNYEYEYEYDTSMAAEEVLENDEEWDGFQSYTMQRIVAAMFGKPAEEVTEEDLATIQYLKLETSWMDEECVVSYSLEDYHNYPPNYDKKIEESADDILFAYNEEFLETIKTITVIYADRDSSQLYEELAAFKNVKAICLDEYEYLDLSQLSGLSMVDCGWSDLSELLEAELPVEQIEALRIDGNDMEGVDKLPYLKKLYLEDCDLLQLEEVTRCGYLEDLYCINMSGSANYACLGKMDSLKTLYIDGSYEEIKDLSGLASLSELENLTVKDTEILNIDFIADMTNLKRLKLSENGQVVNYDVLSGLTNLTFLELNINALHGEQPDCSGIGNLKNLKTLVLHTVYDLDFLYELEQLEELEVRLTFYNYLLEPIRKMHNLKSLTLAQCNSQYEDGFAALSELTELKSLTIEQMDFDTPADGLFVLDTLEELRITNCSFYVAPMQVVAGENLRVLDLSYTEFITMPDSGPYVYVGYADESVSAGVLQNYLNATTLEELYLDYYLLSDISGLNNLSNLKILSLNRCDLPGMVEADLVGCPLLEELYLASNQISDISFVKNLPNLERIDLEGCYVTDMKPLLECPNLKYVNVLDNPITVNPLDGVEVIK